MASSDYRSQSQASMSQDLDLTLEGLDEGLVVKKYKNERWTRVFNVDPEMLSHIQIRVLKEDIEEQDNKPLKPKKKKRKKWGLLYDPEQLTKEHGELKFGPFTLSE